MYDEPAFPYDEQRIGSIGKKMTLIPLEYKGDVVLYDIYINDKWHGSRRTTSQCESYFASLDPNL